MTKLKKYRNKARFITDKSLPYSKAIVIVSMPSVEAGRRNEVECKNQEDLDRAAVTSQRNAASFWDFCIPHDYKKTVLQQR